MIARISQWAVGAILILLYIYLVIAAVGNLIGLKESAAGIGLIFTLTGWFWVILGVVIPIAALVIALLVGRGQRAGTRLLVLAAGIAVVAVFQFEIMYLVPQSTFFAAE